MKYGGCASTCSVTATSKPQYYNIKVISTGSMTSIKYENRPRNRRRKRTYFSCGRF